MPPPLDNRLEAPPTQPGYGRLENQSTGEVFEYRESPATLAVRQDAVARRNAQRQAAYEQALVNYLAKSAKANQAKAAVEAAIRFQGMRLHEQELRSGATPEQALAKHGARMFFSHPGALPGMIRETRPPFVPEIVKFPAGSGLPPVGVRSGVRGERIQFPPASSMEMDTPTQGTPVRTPEGTLLGHHVRTGPRSFTLRPPPLEGLNQSQQGQALSTYQRSLEAVAKDLINTTPQERAEAIKELKRLTETLKERAFPPRVAPLRMGGTQPSAIPSQFEVPGQTNAPAATSPAGLEETRRVNVIGPPGPDGRPRRGTVPEGTPLPEGWKLAQ